MNRIYRMDSESGGQVAMHSLQLYPVSSSIPPIRSILSKNQASLRESDRRTLRFDGTSSPSALLVSLPRRQISAYSEIDFVIGAVKIVESYALPAGGTTPVI